jgi:hypothetical protein
MARQELSVNYFMRGIQMPPWKDYVEGMEHTFDSLTEALRDGTKPSRLSLIVLTVAIKTGEGILIGIGLSVGLAIARASVGL